MIDAVTVTPQIVGSGDSILFGTSRIHTGCSAKHESGSGRFVLLKPGIYEVTFGANVSLPEKADVHPIILDISQDGESIAGSRMIYTPQAPGEKGNVSRTVLVRVYEPCRSSLSVINETKTPIRVQDANFVITRHC